MSGLWALSGVKWETSGGLEQLYLNVETTLRRTALSVVVWTDTS